MKHKTIELEGALLDLAVATALGLTRIPHQSSAYRYWTDQRGHPASGQFLPSIDWAIGGPIIEVEQIGLVAHRPFASNVVVVVAEPGFWSAQVRHGFRSDGPTPLIAAMRAFVASKLGDEVDLP